MMNESIQPSDLTETLNLIRKMRKAGETWAAIRIATGVKTISATAKHKREEEYDAARMGHLQ